MMEWRDEGFVLAVRRHGENDAVLWLFTREHGRHAGILKGGAGRRHAALRQPGGQVAATWRARLGEHLGAFVLEPLRSRAGALGDPLALAGLGAICALLHAALPERAPHGGLWEASVALLDAPSGTAWPTAYLRWEMLLLDEMGYGLDLGRCAVTGATGDLAYVSPRTGRAVSRAGAGEWAARLLPLPGGLAGAQPGGGELSGESLRQALALTGHFLARELAAVVGGRGAIEARGRLADHLARCG